MLHNCMIITQVKRSHNFPLLETHHEISVSCVVCESFTFFTLLLKDYYQTYTFVYIKLPILRVVPIVEISLPKIIFMSNQNAAYYL